MASITMSPTLPIYHQSPLTTPDDHQSPSPLESPPFSTPSTQLGPAFVFPERRSLDQERPTPGAAMALPVAGGSHGRRHSRQGRPTLPDFSFNPGAAMAAVESPQPSPTSPRTHPILEEMAANSRRVHAKRPSALPAFNFNPGAQGETNRTPSPTKATFGDALPKPAHRRQGSEMVVEAAATLPSSSPIKDEATQSKGPPVSNHPPRGHRHRRSDALSVAEIDLSALIKESAMSKHRAGSAPSTPAEVSSPTFFDHGSVSSPASPNAKKTALATPPASPGRRGSLPGGRPRVAFSETVAEIPRPLSMISSATEESTSTVRAGHSASGSVNSFTSPARSNSLLSISRDEPEPQRPKSAEGIVVPTKNEELPSPNTSPKRPLSASGTPSPSSSSQSPPFKKKHFWSANSSDDEEQDLESYEASSEAGKSDLPTFSPSDSSDIARPRTSPERKASLKRRKVRSWTNGIFTRKSKQRPARKGRRTPTPPLPQSALDDIFDNDDTVVIEKPANTPARLPLLETQPRSTPTSSEAEKTFDISNPSVVSPVIDLDAALGPFGSPDSGTSTAAWRRLHSSRGLADPSSPYHRRAESAPHLPPVSRGAFGFTRMGSNPSMSEQAIDEEEEDDYLAGKGRPTPDTGREHTSVEVESGSEFTPSPPGTSAAEREGNLQANTQVGPVGNRLSSSTILPPITGDHVPRRPASAPMDFAVSMMKDYAGSTGGTSGPASFISSPDADHISFDSQQARQPRYLGEPSNDHLHRSTDDVPSLTDSVSTATGHVPRISSSANTRSSTDQRSASFSGYVPWSPARASKRASLVSLSRLIPGSSHGEKSKLRFGETAQHEQQDKQQKRKSNRLSRLMTFWKTKEK